MATKHLFLIYFSFVENFTEEKVVYSLTMPRDTSHFFQFPVVCSHHPFIHHQESYPGRLCLCQEVKSSPLIGNWMRARYVLFLEWILYKSDNISFILLPLVSFITAFKALISAYYFLIIEKISLLESPYTLYYLDCLLPIHLSGISSISSFKYYRNFKVFSKLSET